VVLLCAGLTAGREEDKLCWSAVGGESGCQGLSWRNKSASYLVVICSCDLAVRIILPSDVIFSSTSLFPAVSSKRKLLGIFRGDLMCTWIIRAGAISNLGFV